MKRALFAIGLMACVAVSESQAGYLIVRVILEGGAAGAGTGLEGGGFYPGSDMGGAFPMEDPAGLAPAGGFAPPPGGFAPPPGGAMPGMMPGMGMPSGPAAHDPAQSILVVVPLTRAVSDPRGLPFYYKKDYRSNTNPFWKVPLFHKFGHTNFYADNALIQGYAEYGSVPSPNRTKQSEVAEKYQAWTKNPSSTQALLDILTNALELGMVKESLEYADQLLTQVRQKKAAATPQVERFLTAYEKIQKSLRASAVKPSDAQYWKETLLTNYPPMPNDQVRGHYCLIYWDATQEERDRRLTKLEENFQAFFLLNALRGVALPVPDKPLTVVLPRTAREAIQLSKSLDGLTLVADAFYAPEHDILVLSPERLDANGRTFSQQMRNLYRQGANRSDLLSGARGPNINRVRGAKGAMAPEEVARMMTMVMVECFVEEEFEWAGISREGSRQLLYATGVLPKHVAIPLWLSNGSCEFFTRPKGPVFSSRGKEEKNYATFPLHTGYGVPNYVRHKQFNEMLEKKQLNSDPGMLLRYIISDAYFDAIQRGIDADDPKLPPPLKKKKAAASPMMVPGIDMPGVPPGMPGVVPGMMPTATAPVESPQSYERRKREFLTDKAYATSWALYYYLAKYDATGLDRYIAELDRIPRDWPLDEPTRIAVFAQAFNLTTESAPANGKKSFAQFAQEWLGMMETIPPYSIEIELTDPKPPMMNVGGEGALPGFAPMPGMP